MAEQKKFRMPRKNFNAMIAKLASLMDRFSRVAGDIEGGRVIAIFKKTVKTTLRAEQPEIGWVFIPALARQGLVMVRLIVNRNSFPKYDH